MEDEGQDLLDIAAVAEHLKVEPETLATLEAVLPPYLVYYPEPDRREARWRLIDIMDFGG